MNEIVTTDGEIIEASIVATPVFSQELDVQIATAKRFPRRKDRDIALRIADRATLTPEIAKECIFNVERGGKAILGPSIRLAEIIRSCYGNIYVKARFVRIDAEDRAAQAVICEAVAIDVESNDMESAQVRRSIMTSPKRGEVPRRFSADMISTAVMAAQAIARRNAILALVPKALWIDAYDKVMRVVEGDEKTLSARRTDMLQAFKKLGVPAEKLFEAMGVESEAEIGTADMPRLQGMWNAIKDGESAEAVLGTELERHKPKHETVANPLASSGPAVDAGEAKPPEPPKTKGRKSRSPGPSQAALQAAWNGEVAPSNEPYEPHRDPFMASAIGDMADKTNQAKAVAKPAQVTAEERDSIPGFLDRREAKGFLATALAELAAYAGPRGGLIDWYRATRILRSALSPEEGAQLDVAYGRRLAELTS